MSLKWERQRERLGVKAVGMAEEDSSGLLYGMILGYVMWILVVAVFWFAGLFSSVPVLNALIYTILIATAISVPVSARLWGWDGFFGALVGSIILPIITIIALISYFSKKEKQREDKA